MTKLKATFLLALGLGLASTTVQAQEFMRKQAEVEQLLSGSTFIGVYLRTEAAYTLNFAADGQLTDTNDGVGRWWVDEEGRYCREWLEGKLKGNKACMDVQLEDGQVALFSKGEKVVEGIVIGR
jgi:hypothetical protein